MTLRKRTERRLWGAAAATRREGIEAHVAERRGDARGGGGDAHVRASRGSARGDGGVVLGDGGREGSFGAGPEEAVEAAGDEDVPLLLVHFGERGEHAVEGRVVEHVHRALTVSWGTVEAVEPLEGFASSLEGVGRRCRSLGGCGSPVGRDEVLAVHEGDEEVALLGVKLRHHGEHQRILICILGRARWVLPVAARANSAPPSSSSGSAGCNDLCTHPEHRHPASASAFERSMDSL